jgi:hypothetical protein
VNPSRFLRGIAAPAAAALALAVAAGAPLGAQSKPKRLYVSVVDAKGVPVKDVAPTDLAVREDGVAREILKVEPATEPMRIALLVDNSEAATGSIQFLRPALSSFATRMTAAGHSVALVTLGDRPTLEVDATTDAARLKSRGIDRLFARPGSGMYLLEAILDTSKGFMKNETQRPVMVAVVTEGIEFSNASAETVVKAIRDSGSSFYALVLTEGARASNQNEEVRQRNIALDRGTAENGGRRDIVISHMALKDRLDAVANELLAIVAVTYASPDRLVPPEKIAVSAARAPLTARGVPVREMKPAPPPER